MPLEPDDLPCWYANACAVDWIEEEYDVGMRLYSDRPDIIVMGHWYLCPEGAYPVPYLHPWLACENHRGEFFPETELGEVPSTRRHCVRPRNPRLLGLEPLGDAEVWMESSTYDHRGCFEVDVEGIPIKAKALPLGSGGHYFFFQKQKRAWSIVMRHGAREDGTWHHERSWQGAVTTTAHYASVWFHRRAWQGVYETTDHFAGPWHQERSWGVVAKTTAHYASAWHQERSCVGVYETLEHKASAWDEERSLSVVVKTSAVMPESAGLERSWSAVVKTSSRYAATWDQEESWLAVFETLDHFAAAWKREHQWSMVKKTTAKYAGAWDQERSWQAFVTTPVSETAGWHREHQWSAVTNTVDAVISFSCGAQTAAGTTQGTATAIAFDTVLGTSTGPNQGFILPAACNRIIVRNNNAGGGNNISVYPPTGAKLGAGVANSPIGLSPGSVTLFCEVSATQWDYISLN